MKILVTGSSGTIGTNLSESLINQGHEVIGVDWKPNKWSKIVDDVTIKADLRDRITMQSLLPVDIDLVVHLAANARVHNLVVDPSLARDNFETLFNVLEYARINKITKFIFASSREVYGNTGIALHSEDDALTKNCESPYTASKIGGEAMVHSYKQCYDIDFAIVRFSNVYGMYDESDRIVPLFIQLCAANKDLTVYGEDKILDFTYITDAVTGVTTIIENFDILKNEVYNIASSKGTSLLEAAKLIKEEMNSESNVTIELSRVGEVVKYIADISKIQERTNFSPRVSIQDGIKLSVDWYTKNIL